MDYTSFDNLRVASYNIHYGAGPTDDFKHRATKHIVLDNLRVIAKTLEDFHPDVVCLQEVDFESARSFDIDQADYLAQRLRLPYVAKVTNWRKRYVPFPYWPPTEHFGHVHSGLSVLSRFPIKSNIRYLFDKPLSNPWYYNLLYIDRCAQKVIIQLPKKELQIWNIHLEAFDIHTRMKQAETLKRLIESHPTPFVVVAGDMNALPPNAAKVRGFSDDEVTDYVDDETLNILRKIRHIQPTVNLDGKDEPGFTFPSGWPDRRLDYIFISKWIKLREEHVLGGIVHGSDHLPVGVVVDFGR